MSAGATVSQLHGLKAKRDALPTSERKIVKKCTEAFEEQLIDAIPELVSGLEVSGRQSSISVTTTLKKAKGANISIGVHPRVRAAREGEEFEIHLTDDRQLDLGWVDVDDEDDDEFESPPTGDQPDDAFED